MLFVFFLRYGHLRRDTRHVQYALWTYFNATVAITSQYASEPDTDPQVIILGQVLDRAAYEFAAGVYNAYR